MKVKEIMTPNVEIINPDMPITEAAKKMKEMDVGILPIGENDRLVGMITDRDITIRAVSEGKDCAATNVRDVMTPHVKYVFDDVTIEEACNVMSEHQIRRLIVLDRDKRAVGICSLGDLVVDSGEEKLAGEALEEISKPAKPNR